MVGNILCAVSPKKVILAHRGKAGVRLVFISKQMCASYREYVPGGALSVLASGAAFERAFWDGPGGASRCDCRWLRGCGEGRGRGERSARAR
eukprot:scaffold318862_cov35-Tisochrysis_lutea.AAC.1